MKATQPLPVMTATRPPRDVSLLPAGRTCESCFHFARHCQKHYAQAPDAVRCEYIPQQYLPRLPLKAAD